MEKCFVIQPFDKDKFDARYKDVFSHAIINAGLTPYRIDNDISVRKPIEEIEKGISESAICFAEITIDNPNVWYELGYAFACGKDVVMVCSDERIGKFPFDIQHRHIITYKTRSPSDFELLKQSITDKITAFLATKKTTVLLNATPVVEQEGLSSYEIAILLILLNNQYTDDFGSFNLVTEMDKAGYNSTATNIGIKTLERKTMVNTQTVDAGWNNQYFTAISLSPAGLEWILDNKDKFTFRKEPPKQLGDDDDLPF